MSETTRSKSENRETTSLHGGSQGKVLLDISMSLDGFITGPDDSPEQPLGEGGERLHDWMFLPSGGSIRPEVDEERFKTIGAMVMGRRMFDVGEEPWGENPPFHMPVFVLTHNAKKTLIKEGGTSYTFVTSGIENALAQAKAAASDQNVQVMGGADIAQQFLMAGLLDEIQIHLVPVLLGKGKRLFEHLGSEPTELEITSVIQSKEVTHLRFRIVK
jgi:dihydrofolate reductase